MYSFYGGQPGKPFTISTIFSNKKELVSDLQKRWISDIMPGEYVMISYGSYSIYSSDEGDKTQYQVNYDIDYPIYNRSYNGTLWEKIYYEPTEQDIADLINDDFTVGSDPGGTGFEDITDGNGITFLMSGNETIFYSRDYGLGYKLITAMVGNTPLLGVAEPTIILGPLEDPDVTIDSSDINNPELQFYLPRAVKFYFGDLLGTDTNPIVGNFYYVSSDPFEGEEIRKGDYYINRNTGYVYRLEDIKGNSYGFTFQACFQPPAPESVHNVVNPYYQDEEGQYRTNYPRITFNKIANGWQAIIETPKMPDFTVGPISFVGPLEQGYVEGHVISDTQYQYTFTVPRGSHHFSGGEVEGSPTSSVIIPNAKPGDVYINTNINSPYNGHVYMLNTNSQWEDQGSIKGSTGDALKVVGNYNITPTEVANDSLEDIGNYLTGLGVSLQEDELIAVTYIDASGEDTSYWYYQLDNKWNRVRITGGLNSILKDEYVADSDEGYVYTTRYINSLIVSDTSPSINPDRNTYNITTINELLDDVQIYWENF